MSNRFERRFSFWDLIYFSVPNIIMMIFLSLYTIVDGIFVSRFVGTLALSAINMTYPMECVQLAVGFMFATGGSAIIARRMGEGKGELAKENFTFIVMTAALTGLFFAVFVNIFMDQVLSIMGTSQAQWEYCEIYARILLGFSPFYFLQICFQTLFATAGKPQIGLMLTIIAGIENMVLDYLFIYVLDWGIAGAAIATGMGFFTASVIGLVYFTVNRKGQLYFVKFKPDMKMLLDSCTNGASEMVGNMANAITTFLFNIFFMKYYQEDGVAAITMVQYSQFVYTAVYFGFSLGVAPIISYKYGAKAKDEIRQIFRYCMIFVGTCSIISYSASMLTMDSLIGIFAEEGSAVYHLTLGGFPVFAAGFLLMGLNSFSSAMFTAFSNGKVSAIISFSRTFLFLAGSIILLPLIFGGHALWYTVPVAEVAGAAVSIFFIIKYRKVYGYSKLS